MTVPTPDIGTLLAPGALARPQTRLSGPAVIQGDQNQQSFNDVLGIARTRNYNPGPNATPEEIQAAATARELESREAAQEFVAKVFLEPVLASLRENSQAAPPFAPTQAEKQFRAFADARLAIDVVKRADLPIVDRLARDLLA